MSATTTLASPLSEPAIVENPYPTYAALAETDPVHWWSDADAWAVMRYADCAHAFTDAALSAERMGPMLQVKFPEDVLPEDSIYFRFVSNVMMYADRPLHGTLRKSVTPAFNGSAHQHYENMIQKAAAELVDSLAGDHVEIDVVTDLAKKLPVMSGTRVFGVPHEDLGFVVPRVDKIMSFWAGPQTQRIPLAEILGCLTELHEYGYGLVRGEQGHVPAGTAIARLLEDPPDLPLDQIVHQLVLVFIALFAPTTPGSISSGLLAFSRNPDQIRALRDNPELAENAAHEIFRYNASNQFTWRVATTTTTIGEVEVHPDDVVTLFIGSANRDSEVFDDPNEFRIDRANSDQHLTFGRGMHSCLGSRIAHLQVRSLTAALFDRFATIELVADPVWNANLEFRSLQSLPVRLS